MVREKRNEKEYQQISSNSKSQVMLQFYCENVAIPITEDLEMLGVTVDDKMKFERHISNVGRKVSQQIALLKRMRISFHLKQESASMSHSLSRT